ncbi:MAG: sigma-70 family RNA polymerase sigma factor [Bacteroidales bacterium]|nr:sigma-70 family RNA polymerase sigma factor [Bacteroidales bacterium]
MTRQEITEFYREHYRRLYNIAWRILRDSGEAEEVMQDTILKFVTGRQRFGSPAQESAWLARTCIHASIDRLRSRRHRDAFLEEYARAEETQTGEEELQGPLPDVAQIRSALDRLKDPYRLILTLVLIEGLDYAEIATLTGRKETTLRSLYSRGRVKLIGLLNQDA